MFAWARRDDRKTTSVLMMRQLAVVFTVLVVVFQLGYAVFWLNQNGVSWIPRPSFLNTLKIYTMVKENVSTELYADESSNVLQTYHGTVLESRNGSVTENDIESSNGAMGKTLVQDVSELSSTIVAGNLMKLNSIGTVADSRVKTSEEPVTRPSDSNSAKDTHSENAVLHSNGTIEALPNAYEGTTTEPTYEIAGGSTIQLPEFVPDEIAEEEQSLQTVGKQSELLIPSVNGRKPILPGLLQGEKLHDMSVQNWPLNIEKCFIRQRNCDQKITGKETYPCVHVPPLNLSSNACSHLMSVRRKPSRTGNQMFQVASLIGTALLHGYTPVIPPNFPILQIFNLPNVIVIDLERNGIFSEKGGMMYTPAITGLSHSKNWTLTGFLQSWKYFKGADTSVRQAFSFKNKYTTAAKKFLGSVSKQGFQNVCIHIRRFSKTPRNTDYYNPSTKYIYRAVDFFRQKLKYVTFILLSHDMEWVKKNINIKGSRLSPFLDPGNDMALMANCDHMILTAGTFGWWGAWLSGGTVVYWRKFVDARSKLQKDFASSYYPINWISMD